MSFKQVCTEYGIEIAPGSHHHTTDGWIQIDCPFCSPKSKRFRMGFHERSGFFNCWHCGGHSFFGTLELLLDPATPKMVKAVAKMIRDDLGSRVISTPEARSRSRGTFTPPRGVTRLSRAHREYLIGRNLDPDEIVRLWRVGGLTIAGRLSWRLFIPVYWQGQPVSWLTRAIGDHPAQRYLSAEPNMETISHKTILYGGDYVRGRMIIVEGPVDVWRIGPGTVATMGTTITSEQVGHIGKCPKRFICFDNEASALKRAEALSASLAAFPGETSIIHLDAKDAAAESVRNVKRLRKLLE